MSSGHHQTRSNNQQQGNSGQKVAPKKESIINLSKYLDKSVRVKFQGGREATGVLKGYDQLLNLVLDRTQEYLRDPNDSSRLTDETRSLGLIVCRGPAIIVVCPEDGHESITNPFTEAE